MALVLGFQPNGTKHITPVLKGHFSSRLYEPINHLKTSLLSGGWAGGSWPECCKTCSNNYPMKNTKEADIFQNGLKLPSSGK